MATYIDNIKIGSTTYTLALTPNKGDSNTPVYFDANGLPQACTSLDLDTSGNAATSSKCNGVIPEWSGSINWADTSWIAAWNSDGTKIKALAKSNFASASHTHSYLPLSGGTLTGILETPGITQTTAYQIAPDGTAEGWYRCAQFTMANSCSPFLILSINRSYYSPSNEGYVFCIVVGYNGDVNISQLAGQVGGARLLKIRVDYTNSGVAYVDFFMASNGVKEYRNTWYIGGYGNARIFTPYYVSSPPRHCL